MICCGFTTTDWRKSKISLQLTSMMTNVSVLSLAISFLLLYLSPPSLATLSSSSYYDFSFYSSVPFVAIHFANTLRRFAASVLLPKMVDSVRNGGRSTAFSITHSLFLFDLASLPTAAQRSTSVIGIRIFSPALAKSMSASMEMTVGASSNPAMVKLVTDPPRDFLPMDAYTTVHCTSSGVALLGSMNRFWESLHTRLNFSLDGLIVRIRY